MKRYKVIYKRKSNNNPKPVISHPVCISQISNEGVNNGVKISFMSNGEKFWQIKYKNGLPNGIDKCWIGDGTQNLYLRNYKKNKWQGIQIIFT